LILVYTLYYVNKHKNSIDKIKVEQIFVIGVIFVKFKLLILGKEITITLLKAKNPCVNLIGKNRSKPLNEMCAEIS